MRTIKIGRSSQNDFVVEGDNSVSRLHAVITISDDGRVLVKDLNSTAGTFVNNQKIFQETLLVPGSVLRLANTTIDWTKVIRVDNKTQVNKKPVPNVSLKNQKVIGRSADCQIRMNYSDVSSHHALIGNDENGNVLIVDSNSTNGTYVNGLIISSPTILKPGDVVMISKKYQLNWQSYFSQKPHDKSHIYQNRNMYAVVAAVMVSLVIVGIWYFMNRDWPPTKVFETYKNSVVLVYEQATYEIKIKGHRPSEYDSDLSQLDNCYINSEGKLEPGFFAATGTGFFISKEGHVMTNKHVVFPVGDSAKDADRVKENVESVLKQIAILTKDNKYYSMSQYVEVNYSIKFLGIAKNDTHVSSVNDLISCTPYRQSDNDEIDVAIIQVNDKKTPCDVIVDLKDITHKSDREIGDVVHTIGFPKGFMLGQTSIGLEANNQSGTITQENGEYLFGHNIRIDHGASGSPIFDCKGRFAGIVVSTYEVNGVSTGYNYAVQPDKAAALFNK